MDALWLLGWDVARERTREEGGRRFPIYGAIPGGGRNLEDQEPEGYAVADVADEGGYCYLRLTGEEMTGAGLRPATWCCCGGRRAPKPVRLWPVKWGWSREGSGGTASRVI